MEALVSVGLWNAAGAVALALVAAGAALVVRRPTVLHALWLLVLLKLLCPPLWAVPIQWPEADPSATVAEWLPLSATPLPADEDRVADGNDVAVILGPPLPPDVPVIPITP